VCTNSIGISKINKKYIVLLFIAIYSLLERRKLQMKYYLKRKPRKHEIKHITKNLGFELTDTYVIIPMDYEGVVRMYKNDGLIA
jgi:hypothetical protein